jgi:hypothetical protein
MFSSIQNKSSKLTNLKLRFGRDWANMWRILMEVQQSPLQINHLTPISILQESIQLNRYKWTNTVVVAVVRDNLRRIQQLHAKFHPIIVRFLPRCLTENSMWRTETSHGVNTRQQMVIILCTRARIKYPPWASLFVVEHHCLEAFRYAERIFPIWFIAEWIVVIHTTRTVTKAASTIPIVHEKP